MSKEQPNMSKEQPNMSKEQPNMKLRMPGKDYTDPGYYFCTLVVEGRRHLFGRVAAYSSLTHTPSLTHAPSLTHTPSLTHNVKASTPEGQSGCSEGQSGCSEGRVSESGCSEGRVSESGCSEGRVLRAPYGHSHIYKDACIAYTPYGQRVAYELEKIGTEGRYKGTIEVKGKAVMPDHIHVLLLVKVGIPKPIGWVLNGFNTGCRRIWKDLCGIRIVKTEPVLLYEPCKVEVKTGSWQLPEGQAAWPKEQPDGALSIFESGYNDQVVYRDGQLDGYYRYMEANAWRLLMKQLYPDLFRKVWKKELLPGILFDLIGNMFLLDRPWRVAVRISRYAVEEEAFNPYDPEGSFVSAEGKRVLRNTKYLYPKREKTKEEIETAMLPYLQLAKAGAVLVTPCISPAEQEVVQAAYKEGLPVVMMSFNGFNRCYHPSKAHYDACSRGILLQLAPWRYDPGRKMSKALCEELNELAFRFASL